jgi:hypothetical protein
MTAFEAEREAYLRSIDIETELERLAAAVEDLEIPARRREAGLRYAKMLGLPENMSKVAGIMILSPSRDARVKAADVIVRSLQRAVRVAA